jgi:hypothetical protein
MHRHRNSGVAAALFGCDLHRHFAHDLPQMRRPEPMGIAQSQECVVQDVEHQPCFCA